MQLVKQSFQVLVYARPAEWGKFLPLLPQRDQESARWAQAAPNDCDIAFPVSEEGVAILEAVLAEVQREATDAPTR